MSKKIYLNLREAEEAGRLKIGIAFNNIELFLSHPFAYRHYLCLILIKTRI